MLTASLWDHTMMTYQELLDTGVMNRTFFGAFNSVKILHCTSLVGVRTPAEAAIV